MTISKGRLIAARSGRLDLEQRLCADFVEQRKRQQPPSDGQAFHLSVQFALAHGVQPAIPRGEITTLHSSTLLSGARSR